MTSAWDFLTGTDSISLPYSADHSKMTLKLRVIPAQKFLFQVAR